MIKERFFSDYFLQERHHVYPFKLLESKLSNLKGPAEKSSPPIHRKPVKTHRLRSIEKVILDYTLPILPTLPIEEKSGESFAEDTPPPLPFDIIREDIL